jgi:hypothetical protein
MASVPGGRASRRKRSSATAIIDQPCRQMTMIILAISILITSRAITMIDTIVEGAIMVISITIMAIDDRWIELNN